MVLKFKTRKVAEITVSRVFYITEQNRKSSTVTKMYGKVLVETRFPVHTVSENATNYIFPFLQIRHDQHHNFP